VEIWDLPRFYEPLHYHEECQITLIRKSKGFLFAGDSFVEFAEGDLLFIGENLPHVFKNDKITKSEGHINAISVFFSKKIMLSILNAIPEASKQIELLETSDLGLKIKRAINKDIGKLIQTISSTQRFNRTLQLLKVIDLLTNSTEIKQISSRKTDAPTKDQSEKLDAVFEYVMLNYDKPIQLAKISSLVFMTPNSFCRFFKSHTLKTFSSFLIEVRIKKACIMLLDKYVTVADACYASGYNNLSNFHRHFQRIMGETPSRYKNKYADISA
jgi:YesN/AraC family two-component response regulator